MRVKVTQEEVIVINAPEYFQNKEFMAWLNADDTTVATWYQKGTEPNDWSDIFTTWDSGEGPDADMPAHIWGEITAVCEEHLGKYGFCILRITNLEED